MYYTDLSPYSHYLDVPIINVKNIGWLDEKHDFKKGVLEAKIYEKLKNTILEADLVDVHVNIIRGSHPCNICGAEDVIFHGKNNFLGRSELWIPSGNKNGEYFAAPTMILHYIKEHCYLPPEDFIFAVNSFSFDSYFNAQEVYLEMVNRPA